MIDNPRQRKLFGGFLFVLKSYQRLRISKVRLIQRLSHSAMSDSRQRSMIKLCRRHWPDALNPRFHLNIT